MTVSELMDVLGRYPADLRVVVDGYEEGYDDLAPSRIFVVKIALNTGTNDWEGLHGETTDGAATTEQATVVDALVFRRASR